MRREAINAALDLRLTEKMACACIRVEHDDRGRRRRSSSGTSPTVDAAINRCFPLVIDYDGRQLIVQGKNHASGDVASTKGVGYLAKTNIVVLSSRWSGLGGLPLAMGCTQRCSSSCQTCMPMQVDKTSCILSLHVVAKGTPPLLHLEERNCAHLREFASDLERLSTIR